MCNADCISKLYFATVCQISSYNILCNIPCCIRCGTVYLRRVFTAECTAAVTSRTAISIYNNLSTSQTAVTLWTTNDKPTSRVDIILRVFVQHFRRQYWSNDIVHQIRANLFQCHSRSVLGREYHCINPLWLAVYIFYGYLCLAIWTEILQNFFFPYIGQLHAELMCERNCQRHQFLCFLARITEHHTLVTSTGFLMFAAPAFIGIVDTHCDIRRLLVHCL